MGNIVVVLNGTDGTFGGSSGAINNNQNNINEFDQKLGVLEALLKTISDLINRVTGLDLGLFSGASGGAGLGGLPVDTSVLPLGR